MMRYPLPDPVFHQGIFEPAKMLLDRVIPIRRPEGAAVHIETTGSFSADAKIVMAEVFAGAMPPEVGSSLVAGLNGVAKAVETGELVKRLEALESSK